MPIVFIVTELYERPDSIRPSRGAAWSAHMRFISLGTPGIEMITLSSVLTNQPGAVPTGLGSASADGISHACLALRSGIARPRLWKNDSISARSAGSTVGDSLTASA